VLPLGSARGQGMGCRSIVGGSFEQGADEEDPIEDSLQSKGSEVHAHCHITSIELNR
jgi:hypothetical protein